MSIVGLKWQMCAQNVNWLKMTLCHEAQIACGQVAIPSQRVQVGNRFWDFGPLLGPLT
jgi:hypothetical protein